MIVSTDHQCVFVHVWKTGGTSIAIALRKEFGIRPPGGFKLAARRANFALRRSLGLPVLGKHAYALDIRNHLGRDYDLSFSFGFVRNPWDWLVSWFHFVSETRMSPDTGKPWRHHQYDEIAGMSFLDFVAWVVEDGGLERSFARKHSSFAGRRPFLQRDWLSDLEGNLIVDFVGHFETLEEDIQLVSERLGCLGLELPHLNRSDHRSYRTYYSPEARLAVADYFQEDIQTFGYSF